LGRKLGICYYHSGVAEGRSLWRCDVLPT